MLYAGVEPLVRIWSNPWNAFILNRFTILFIWVLFVDKASKCVMDFLCMTEIGTKMKGIHILSNNLSCEGETLALDVDEW